MKRFDGETCNEHACFQFLTFCVVFFWAAIKVLFTPGCRIIL